jgi:hypothetical protein
VTPMDRMLAMLDDLAGREATSYAVARLLQRRPDLTPPAAGLPVIVPREEDAAFTLDKLAFLAWVARQASLVAEVGVSMALSAGATWPEIATAARMSTEEARARYGHLAPRALGGDPR